MNIVIFSHELPWPANHGGRIDLYNRLRVFKELNHNVFLVCWALFEDNKSPESINHVKNLIDELVCFPRKNNFYNLTLDKSIKLLKLTYQPNLVTQCSLSKKGFIKLSAQIKNFEPDAIFVDNIYAAKLAYKFADYMNLPVFIRSHNVEHIYIKKMANISISLKLRFKFLAMSANLENYEIAMLRKANAYFNISLSDLSYWNQRGIKNGYWMPPVYYENEIPGSVEITSNKYDIAYIGNLNSPNNIHGLFWFLEKIFPYIEKFKPNTTMLIAGSRPTEKVFNYCKTKKKITLLPDPKCIKDLYRQSKVLINPICFGSGVNIKTVEMLHFNNPVVCTPKAIEGLPKEMEAIFEIADHPEDFALKILKHLTPTEIPLLSRTNLQEYFKPEYMISNMEIMEKVCHERKLGKI